MLDDDLKTGSLNLSLHQKFNFILAFYLIKSLEGTNEKKIVNGMFYGSKMQGLRVVFVVMIPLNLSVFAVYFA